MDPKRALGMPETVAENAAGSIFWASIVVLVFRFVFGDEWAVALLVGAIWAPLSFTIIELLRRRRSTRG